MNLIATIYCVWCDPVRDWSQYQSLLTIKHDRYVITSMTYIFYRTPPPFFQEVDCIIKEGQFTLDNHRPVHIHTQTRHYRIMVRAIRFLSRAILCNPVFIACIIIVAAAGIITLLCVYHFFLCEHIFQPILSVIARETKSCDGTFHDSLSKAAAVFTLAFFLAVIAMSGTLLMLLLLLFGILCCGMGVNHVKNTYASYYDDKCQNGCAGGSSHDKHHFSCNTTIQQSSNHGNVDNKTPSPPSSRSYQAPPHHTETTHLLIAD